ncbi:MAG: replication-associated recombination protein A [Candidatus Goldbacteria bacterium]|nr:replication-associated recombination protein A [Candidatus Goldiibacteriota bacterium]
MNIQDKMNLFEKEEFKKKRDKEPLAYRMRPQTLEEFMGQKHIIGEGKFLNQALKEGKIPSIIFWGPPGSGKTTLAMIIAKYINAQFISLSAVASGIKEVKEVIEKAKLNQAAGKKTILFIDEIHRFNKAQQDAFLPYVESGLIILIGATTENPSFEVISSLLSRTKVIKLDPLRKEDIENIIRRAITDKEKGLGNKNIKINQEIIDLIDNFSNGDARIALNIIEMIDMMKGGNDYEITSEDVIAVVQKKTFLYDKSGEEHYNLISALHKSLRDSDPDAALYWFARMIVSGEDPMYIARRLIRFASEDIGNADPYALTLSISAMDAYDFIGSPEGELALAQAIIYLAVAPKSNAVYTAYSGAIKDAENLKDEPVPLHLRNPVTPLMASFGYGKGYKYAHDFKDNIVKQEHMPEKLKDRKYYNPTDNGFEKQIKERLLKWKKELQSS